nr:hypothetical protein [Kibdelosporangium sp. MJ126-NF4]CEL12856.1 hypothetical protein [Kibdelosporangium sp. MJ126-NF4]CTQ98542.1 hypothetical protein [Kibdelosporangium sp. MJ126-NF4]
MITHSGSYRSGVPAGNPRGCVNPAFSTFGDRDRYRANVFLIPMRCVERSYD